MNVMPSRLSKRKLDLHFTCTQFLDLEVSATTLHVITSPRQRFEDECKRKVEFHVTLHCMQGT